MRRAGITLFSVRATKPLLTLFQKSLDLKKAKCRIIKNFIGAKFYNKTGHFYCHINFPLNPYLYR